MTQLQIASVLQVLALETVVDDDGKEVQTEFLIKKRAILAKMIDFESKGEEHHESSDDSS